MAKRYFLVALPSGVIFEVDRYYILRPDGIILPVDLSTWAPWFEDINNRQVRFDDIGGVQVSTVFLGLDHNFFGKGPPVLFETMMFTDDEQVMIGRACEKLDAIEMHERTVAQCRERLDALGKITDGER